MLLPFKPLRLFPILLPFSLCLSLQLISLISPGQQTMIYASQDKDFRDGQEYFEEGKYAVAMILFKKTMDNIGYFQQTNRQLVLQDATYYYDLCALKLNEPGGERETKYYISHVRNTPRTELASYYLARHYYQKNEFREAIPYYEKAGIDNLSNDQIADARFELAYCYFNVKAFDQAEPLFADIRDLHGKYYIPANYYYGFIAFYHNEYEKALASFQRIVSVPQYNIIVPYYIAEIYYYEHKPDLLISYAIPYIREGNLYYDLDLKHLVGQAYFEKRDYLNAFPYLEAYYNGASKVSKEDVYELSYCYYQTDHFEKAITGFRQLSLETDSLGQNSMYLLAVCFMKIGQKNNARNAFAICARYDYSPVQQQISIFNYGKLSDELGYQDVAIRELELFNIKYPGSVYSTEAKELLTRLFMNTNDYKSALAVLQSIPDKTPEMVRAFQRVSYGRAMQLINDQRLTEADELLNESLIHPVDPEIEQLAWFWKGEISYRLGNTDKAISDINRYLSLGGNNQSATSGQANPQTAEYNLGYCLLKNGDYTLALNAFKTAVKPQGPDGKQIATDAILRTADCYYMLKDYGDALGLYNQIISGDREGADYALYQKSIISGINGNYSAKVSLLQQLSREYPSSSLSKDADFEIGSTYMNNGQYQQAIPFLKNTLNRQPGSPDAPKALLRLGLAYFNLNDNTTAIDDYKHVVQQYPNSPEAGEALQSIKNMDISAGEPDAYLNFLKSTGRTVNPSEADSVNFASAETKFGNGDYTGALIAFNSYLSRFPSGQFLLDANFYKAECLFNSKDYAGALPAYEYVLSQGESRFSERSAAQAAAICFYQTKDYPKAKTYYQQLKGEASTKEDALAALRGLVLCDFQLQDWVDLKSDGPALLASGNTSTDDQIMSYFYLAKAYRALGNCDSSILNDQIVAELTKSEMGAEARYDIAACEYQENNLKSAEPAAFEVIKNTPSYDYWVAKSYLLLGDIYASEKDYFNANATLQSIIDHCRIPELVDIARQKLAQVKMAESASSKISDSTTVDTTSQ